MRPGQQNKRGRGRNNNSSNNSNNGGGNNHNRKGQNPLTRTYDSSGPDVKIRGTAQHIAEKYATLARDAQSAGDRVVAENYLQHAEHYNRIIASAQAQMQERFQRDDRQGYDDRDGGDMNDRDGNMDDDQDQGYDDGPMMSQPAPRVEQPRQEQSRQEQPRQQQPRPQQQPAPVARTDRAEQPDRAERPERAERAERADRPERAERAERPVRAERAVQAERAAPVSRPVEQPVFDGSGPQPDIEGTPAEVAMEDEAAGSTARAPSRRRGTPRPRRPRRSDVAGEEGAADKPSDEGSDTPVLAASD